MMPRTLNPTQWLREARDGAAAVEFALIIPVLIGMVIGIVQYGGQIIAFQQLHNGITSGALYVMRGGSDIATVQSVALNAWPNKPADASMSAVRSCTCSGASASCTVLCADNSYPQSFITISGAGTYAGVFRTQAMSATQVVRTQ